MAEANPMPLFEMSPNMQEAQPGRKRGHDEFVGDLVKRNEATEQKTPQSALNTPSGDNSHPPQSQINPHASPNNSPALTEAGSSTPARNSPAPVTPTKVTNAQSSSSTMTACDTKAPASKRRRLTAVEKEAKDKEMADKKKEREEQAMRKAVEKAKQEEEKAARAKGREEKRKQKEEEDRIKAEQRDEKKRRKEEELRRIQEEKDKKARAQPKLNMFFKMPTTPKKTESDTGSAAASPSKADGTGIVAKETEYDRLFKPFFVRENTRLALPATRMDQETIDAKSKILDEFVSGQRQGDDHLPRRFDPIEILCLPERLPKRGRIHHPVKHIMETAYREAEGPSGAGNAAAGNVFQNARTKLAKIPQKIIAFSQDVRPPYYGTVTLKPYALGSSAMNKLARKPTGCRLPLDYDYDSEAEWQEEEGEDVDMDDDEEELDDEDDMDGFLDDTEDAGVSRRIFGSTLEPDSTGICFENHHRVGPNPTVYEHKMEFIHEGFELPKSIDPFSTRYWEPEPKTKAAKAAQPASETATQMPPPPAPTNAFAALSGNSVNPVTKLVKPELMNDVKQAILDNKALSKVGIIDFIFHQFRDNVSRAEVKNTLEHVAEKKGAGRSKEWDLKPGHEIVS